MKKISVWKRCTVFVLTLAVMLGCFSFYPSETGFVFAADYSNAGCVKWARNRASAKLGISLPATGTYPSGVAGASNWWYVLPQQGYTTGSEPRANSLAIWRYTIGSYANYGHVAYVESVNGDSITITEGGAPAKYSYGGNTGVLQRTTTKSKIGTLDGKSGFYGYVYLEKSAPVSSTLSVSPAKETFSSNEDIVINWSSQSGAVKYGLTVRNSANQDVWDNYVTGNSRNIGRLAPGSYSVLMLAYNSSGKGFGGVKRSSFNVVSADTQAPTITNVYVKDIEHNGYTVVCTVSDNVGITGVKFPSWNCDRDSGNEANWIDGTVSGNQAYAWIPIERLHSGAIEGNYMTHIYAYDASGNWKCVPLSKAVYIDRTAPTVSDVKVTVEKNNSGYTIRCKVADKSGIDRVQFPTWTEKNGQDDINKSWSTSSLASGQLIGNEYVYTVKTSDHNNELGTYITHIYAYDKQKNSVCISDSMCKALKVNISATNTQSSSQASFSQSDSSSSNSNASSTVKKTTTKIAVSTTSVKIRKGKTATVVVKVTPSQKVTGEKIKVSCNNKNVKYSFNKKTGKIKIKGKKRGTSKIKIKAGKKSKTIKVKVTK